MKSTAYLAEKINQKICAHQRYPLGVQNQQGQQALGFPSLDGILLKVFDDGVLIRASEDEIFVSFERVEFFRFPSKVAIA